MDQIRLRALTGADKHITLQWNNKDDIKIMYSGHPFPVNIEMEEEWYKRIIMSNIPTTVFGLELVSEQRLIGLSLLKNIDLINRKAEFALFIGETRDRGKGYSLEATSKTLYFAFNDLGIKRIYLTVACNNTPAIELYKKSGFSEEGRLRKSIFKKGEFMDELIMSVLNPSA